MDLNIKNYRTDELFNLFNLNLENLSLQNLKEQYLKKCQKIENSQENININKEEFKIFFTEAFTKLVDYMKEQDDNKLQQLLDIVESDHPPLEKFLNKGLIPNEKKNKKNPDELLNVDNGLLLPIESTPVIQSNMNNEYTDGQQVQNYIEKTPITVNLQNYKRGNFNPLVKTETNIILNINSLFRNILKGKNSTNFLNDMSSKFMYKMPVDIKRTSALKLISLELPTTIFNISSNLGSNNFKVSKYPEGYDPLVIQIPSGQYNKETLIEAIQKDLSDNSTNINIELIPNTNQVRFYDVSGENFNLEFEFNREIVNENYCSNIINEIPNYVYPLQLTLGWILGFRQELYGENKLIEGISKTEYIGEASCSIDNEQYYFLGIKDFLNNNKQIMYSTFLENTNIAGDIIGRVIYKYDGTINNIITEPREYFGPVRIQNLQIVLYDMFGRILDLNNSDFSLSLLLTTIYNL
jgi:hypothetical protein